MSGRFILGVVFVTIFFNLVIASPPVGQRLTSEVTSSIDKMRSSVEKGMNNSTNSLTVSKQSSSENGSGGGSGTGGSLGPFIPLGTVGVIYLFIKGIIVTMLSSLNTVTIPAIITTLFFLAVTSFAVFVLCIAADCQDNLGTLLGARPRRPVAQLVNRNTIQDADHFEPIYEHIQNGYQLFHGPKPDNF